jgi:cell division inhibitor SulA
MFSLNVPIPDEMVYPTLTSLEYTIKYGTANGQGTCMMQTSILLTKASDFSSNADSARVLDGIATDSPRISIYRTGVGFPPEILDGVPTMCLLSVPATKESCYTSQWNHYIDRQQILPHVRIIEASRLCLQLHVAENPSPLMLRSLVAEVSATWAEDLRGKVLHEKIQAAQMRKAVAESKRADDEQARVRAERKSAEAKRAIYKAEEEEKSAKKKSEDYQLAKKQADEQADGHRIAKEQADTLAETHRAAKKVADERLLFS